ncbi:MAG: hypothetical protein RJQ14_14460, partial [Marinoscillum sp.]
MKLLSALIIASLLLSSCQKNQEKATENSALQNVESPAENNASLPYLIKGGDDLLYMSWVEKRDSGWIDLKYSVLKDDVWQEPEVFASGN